MEWVQVGQRVKEERLRRGWSLRTLGERAGVAHSFIADLEAGTKKQPSMEHLERVASALEMPLTVLTGEAGEEEDLAAEVRSVVSIWRKLPQDYREIAWDFMRMLETRVERAQGTRRISKSD